MMCPLPESARHEYQGKVATPLNWGNRLVSVHWTLCNHDL